MKHIIIEDGLIMLLDRHNHGYDAEPYTTLKAALATIARWQREYRLDLAAARRVARQYARVAA